MKNIGRYAMNIFCKRPITVRVHKEVTRYRSYGKWRTRTENHYLVGNGPSVCPWREVASPDDCQDGEVFDEYMDQKYFKESSTSGYHIKNCKNARQLMACIDYDENEVYDENGEYDASNSMKVQIDFSNEHIDAISECLIASNPEESHTIFDCLENKYSLKDVLEHVNIPMKLKKSVVELRVNA